MSFGLATVLQEQVFLLPIQIQTAALMMESTDIFS